MSISEDFIAQATSGNGAFSRQRPGLQLAVDSTSLGAFKTCPRYYYYSIVCGWQPKSESPHLTFGLLLHSAREDYDRARANGEDHEEALRGTLAKALRSTWNKALARPWISDVPEKNRMTLVRTLVWYLDHYGPGDAMKTVTLGNGKLALELRFGFHSGYTTKLTHEAVTFCGYLDRIAEMDESHYVLDIKTTKSALGPRWFEQFTPGNQFSMYCLAGEIAFERPVKGVIVDGAQVGAGFARFQRGLVQRTDTQLAEWLAGSYRWLEQMEVSVSRVEHVSDPSFAWPQNDTSCDKFGGCRFRDVCGRPPAQRQARLEADFKRRVWDPTVTRGDV